LEENWKYQKEQKKLFKNEKDNGVKIIYKL